LLQSATPTERHANIALSPLCRYVLAVPSQRSAERLSGLVGWRRCDGAHAIRLCAVQHLYRCCPDAQSSHGAYTVHLSSSGKRSQRFAFAGTRTHTRRCPAERGAPGCFLARPGLSCNRIESVSLRGSDFANRWRTIAILLFRLASCLCAAQERPFHIAG